MKLFIVNDNNYLAVTIILPEDNQSFLFFCYREKTSSGSVTLARILTSTIYTRHMCYLRSTVKHMILLLPYGYAMPTQCYSAVHIRTGYSETK